MNIPAAISLLVRVAGNVDDHDVLDDLSMALQHLDAGDESEAVSERSWELSRHDN